MSWEQSGGAYNNYLSNVRSNLRNPPAPNIQSRLNPNMQMQSPFAMQQVNWYNPTTRKRITLPFGDDLPSPWLNQGLVE